VVFWKDIWALIKNPIQKTTGLLIVAVIPAVIAGVVFEDQIEALFSGTIFLAVGFIITGIFLLYSDSVRGGKKTDKDMSVTDALIIGCMQAVGIAPGVSRSGSTITGAIARGLNRETAARFSFLLSIPTILGAAVFTLKDVFESSDAIKQFTAIGVVPLLLGFIAAALSGYLSIRYMLSLIKRSKMKYFAYYVFVLAGLILTDNFATHFFF
jgi:undecaprenyl-diphosphatase